MKIILLVIMFVFSLTTIKSQDLKAGEINIEYISGLTYEARVYFYQSTTTFVNRPFVILDWGAGAPDTLYSYLAGCGDTNTVTHIFSGTHTYPGSGNYFLRCVDSFRIANVQNIPSSQNEKMLLKYELIINPFWGGNSSPTSLNCAHDVWECCNWIYNPSAFDTDGDSLAYQLVQPFTNNYTFPISSVNDITGDMTFQPTTTGQYVFCMVIEEWKNVSQTRYLAGKTYRQMLVDVYSLTSINEFNSQNNISLYPNPFHEQTILELPDKQFTTVNIYNSIGELVRSISNLTDRQVIIYREGLSNGLYYYLAQTDQKILGYGKFVIE